MMPHSYMPHKVMHKFLREANPWFTNTVPPLPESQLLASLGRPLNALEVIEVQIR